VIVACVGWNCDRLISVSDVAGGNPVAADDPVNFSLTFLVCPDCHRTFCDRCVPRGYLFATRCRSCSADLVDGAYYERVLAGAKAAVVQVHDRGSELGAAGRLDEALGAFDEAVRQRETYISAHVSRGVACRLLGRPAEAVAAFECATRLDPTHVQALFDIGGIHRATRQLEQALLAYDRALTMQPRYLSALVNKAVTLSDLDRCEEAVLACNQALLLDLAELSVDKVEGSRPFIYGAKGAALLKLGMNAEALESIDFALAGREDPATLTNRATALERLGRPGEAREAADRAAALRAAAPTPR
jgi:tetratricopeptide (TPR) repeat protein